MVPPILVRTSCSSLRTARTGAERCNSGYTARPPTGAQYRPPPCPFVVPARELHCGTGPAGDTMAPTGPRVAPPVAGHPTAALVAAILSCLAVGQAARNPASAQEDSTRRSDSGVVVGVVTSREMYEPLSGAQVVVVGTALATTTDSLGQFTLRGRSEEHTSELQSLAYLVCRLL